MSARTDFVIYNAHALPGPSKNHDHQFGSHSNLGRSKSFAMFEVFVVMLAFLANLLAMSLQLWRKP